MKKCITSALLSILYTGLSLGYPVYDPSKFNTTDWSKVIPGYESSNPGLLQCGMKNQDFTCWIIKSSMITDQLPTAYVWFKLASDPSKYCEYEVLASWNTARVEYEFHNTGLLRMTPGIKCQTYSQEPAPWKINI